MSFSFNTVASLITLGSLSNVNKMLAISNERLATGKRVNYGRDDPAAIVAIADLQMQMAKIVGIASSGERISSMLDTADGALSQMQTQIAAIDTAIIGALASGATSEEKAAFQSTIDTAIAALDKLAETTEFNGTKLLNGNLSYSATGVATTNISNIKINAADTSGGTIPLAISVTTAAEQAKVEYNSTISSDVTMILTGEGGAYTFNFSNGTSTADIATTIAAQSGTTGITATESGGTMTLTSINYGKDASINVNVTSGTFLTLASASSYDEGVDPVVTVNGETASVSGLSVHYASGSGQTNVSFDLSSAYALATSATSFSITGNGAQFSMGVNDPLNIGIGSLTSASLGSATVGLLRTLKTGGANDVDSGNFSQATLVSALAGRQVAAERSRLGSINKYRVDAMLNSYETTKISLAAAVSSIEDIDYAEETARKSRLEALQTINISLLDTLFENEKYMITKLLG
jgi:flagellin